MQAVLAGVVGLLARDPVDRDQRAVQDRVREEADAPHRSVQVIGSSAEQPDCFLNVAPGGRDPDLEPGREAGVGVPVAQMREGEQGLTARVQSSPPSFVLLTVAADAVARWFRVRLDNEIVDG